MRKIEIGGEVVGVRIGHGGAEVVVQVEISGEVANLPVPIKVPDRSAADVGRAFPPGTMVLIEISALE